MGIVWWQALIIFLERRRERIVMRRGGAGARARTGAEGVEADSHSEQCVIPYVRRKKQGPHGGDY